LEALKVVAVFCVESVSLELMKLHTGETQAEEFKASHRNLVHLYVLKKFSLPHTTSSPLRYCPNLFSSLRQLYNYGHKLLVGLPIWMGQRIGARQKTVPVLQAGHETNRLNS
jgi:hypothetical protein